MCKRFQTSNHRVAAMTNGALLEVGLVSVSDKFYGRGVQLAARGVKFLWPVKEIRKFWQNIDLREKRSSRPNREILANLQLRKL